MHLNVEHVERVTVRPSRKTLPGRYEQEIVIQYRNGRKLVITLSAEDPKRMLEPTDE